MAVLKMFYPDNEKFIIHYYYIWSFTIDQVSLDPTFHFFDKMQYNH